MAYTPTGPFVDVEAGTTPPPGTPKLDAAFYNRLEAGIVSAASAGDLVVNVKDFGAVGDGSTDCTAAINAALTAANGARVFVPAGTFLVSGEIRVPSGRYLFGAGRDRTTITMKSGVEGTLNVVTNAGNTKTARTTYDEHIRISDLTIDGNRPGRTSVGPSNMDGSCINLSTVRYALIERVRVTRGWRHGVDISASEYPENTGALTQAQGPSYFVTVRDCIGEGKFGDDAFTTHYSWGIRIEDCRATTVGIDFDGSQGFEIDDGSRDVVVSNCYASGFAKGFQAKGHDNTTPARQVVFENCVADGCGYGFDLTHDAPTDYVPTGGFPYRTAADIVLRSCRVINTVTVTATYPERRSLRIMGYDGVKVQDFVVFGSTGGNIIMGTGCSNIELDGVVLENVFTAPNAADEALVHVYATAGSNITLRNIKVRSPITQSAVRVSTSAGNVLVRDVVATATAGTTYPCVSLATLDSNTRAENIMATGFAADVESTGGTIMGTWPREAAARVAGPDWLAVPLPSGWTGNAYMTKIGKQATVQLSNVIPNATGTLTLANLAPGYRPIRQADFPGATPRVWVAANGDLRGNWTSGVAVFGVLTYPIGN